MSQIASLGFRGAPTKRPTLREQVEAFIGQRCGSDPIVADEEEPS